MQINVYFFGQFYTLTCIDSCDTIMVKVGKNAQCPGHPPEGRKGMPVSDAKKKANARWNASKDNIMIRPTKEEGAAIRAAATAAGQSNQQYILQATRERMAREAVGSPVSAIGVSLHSEDGERAPAASERLVEGKAAE